MKFHQMIGMLRVITMHVVMNIAKTKEKNMQPKTNLPALKPDCRGKKREMVILSKCRIF